MLPRLAAISLTSLAAVVAAMSPARSAQAQTVADAVDAGCSTSQVLALSEQIIVQMTCDLPNAFERLEVIPSNVTLGPAALPYAQPAALDALSAAVAANPNTPLQINSMMRSVVQQYLVFRWRELGKCGIGQAATPGNSNHETGLAIDIQQYASWEPHLTAEGFNWPNLPNDAFHFDYAGSGIMDLQGEDVSAFQYLWNKNNPGDLIGVDGAYGPQTRARIEMSPAAGFPLGADCSGPPPPPPPPGAVSITVDLDAEDTFGDGASAGVRDAYTGEPVSLSVTVVNGTQSALANEPLDITFSGTAVSLAQSLPSIDVPAASTKTFAITLDALERTVDQSPSITVSTTLGAQTVDIDIDVYDRLRWKWQSDRLEGWQGAAGQPQGGLIASTDGATVISPALNVAVTDDTALSLRIAVSPGATKPFVAFQPDGAVDGVPRLPLDVPDDGELHDITLDVPIDAGSAMLTALAIGAEGGTVQIDDVELTGAGVAGDEDCGCRVAGRPQQRSGWLGLALAAVAATVRRRKRS